MEGQVQKSGHQHTKEAHLSCIFALGNFGFQQIPVDVAESNSVVFWLVFFYFF
jgi:hypothetical protein